MPNDPSNSSITDQIDDEWKHSDRAQRSSVSRRSSSHAQSSSPRQRGTTVQRLSEERGTPIDRDERGAPSDGTKEDQQLQQVITHYEWLLSEKHRQLDDQSTSERQDVSLSTRVGRVLQRVTVRK